MFAPLFNRFQEIFGRLRSEARLLRDAPISASRFELRDVFNFELFVERLHFLATKPLQFKELKNCLGKAAP